VPDIVFDENGVCNYCKLHDALDRRYPLDKNSEKVLKSNINKIKEKGKNKRYDCIIGVSGGTDSTYVLYLAKKWGLRPLAVHFDNGWDSEIAVTNIKNATDKLDIDLYTYVMDWEEFKDLQISFLKASVPDAEIPTDIGIIGTLYLVANQERIKYVIDGHSFRTEGTSPIFWTYMDGKYIESVQNQFGKMKLNKFPNVKMANLFYFSIIKGIHGFRPLEYMEYDKVAAGKILEKEIGWKYYGGHHHECIYTKFHHSYLLIKKFGIDYRKASISGRIRSGLISRNDALDYLKNNPYIFEEDVVEYVIKKIGLSKKEFNRIMKKPLKTFLDYPTYYPLIKALRIPLKIATKFHLIHDVLYLKYGGQFGKIQNYDK
jgi:N-acetyl sugar amidotransferase